MQPEAGTAPMLCVRDLEAWYDESYVLQGIDLDVREGEVVTLLGRNGAGKSTTLKSIMGMMDRCAGTITFKGSDIRGAASHRIALAGIGYCPEERGIFSSLTVAENMILPPRFGDPALSLERIYELFPNLLARRASFGSKLSGGEQQMLAIGRLLRTGARFLLLDEPTEGLAPVIVEQIGRVILELKRAGLTILLVEQNFVFVSQMADRHYVMEDGKIVDVIANDRVQAEEGKIRKYLGV
ncbi:MAG: ABC transporter ATP-binding protein [Rhizobiaceae bacterium]